MSVELQSSSLIYTLQDYKNIIFDGFDINLPKETIDLINLLSSQVGSPTYIKTPVFNKKEDIFLNKTLGEDFNRRRKNRSGYNDTYALAFQPTKIETKNGIDLQIDSIRACLNKMTDKNYTEYLNKIVEILILIADDEGTEHMVKVGNSIFDIASNNRF